MHIRSLRVRIPEDSSARVLFKRFPPVPGIRANTYPSGGPDRVTFPFWLRMRSCACFAMRSLWLLFAFADGLAPSGNASAPFVFLHVPKTAGASVRSSLRSYCDHHKPGAAAPRHCCLGQARPPLRRPSARACDATRPALRESAHRPGKTVCARAPNATTQTDARVRRGRG